VTYANPSIFPSSQRPVAVALLVAVAWLGAGCEEKSQDKEGSQTVARVNKQAISAPQIDFVLQQQRGLKPEQATAASKQVLERLIDQELTLQKAAELKLDREPRIVQQIEAARREVVSRAYLERAGEAAAKPTPEELKQYYEDKPALFKDRRIFSLQEITIEARPEQIAELKAKLEGSKNIAQFVEYLRVGEYRFTANQAVRAAEQLPLASLGTFAGMKDGQALLNATPTGAQVIVLAGSRSQPVSLDQAKPAIEQFLLNERKRELIAKDLKALRDAATIEYLGKYAEAASAPPPAAAAVGPVGASSSPSAPAK
jgi:EpsD family peptidyl-prolyl cis-trans isomerase